MFYSLLFSSNDNIFAIIPHLYTNAQTFILLPLMSSCRSSRQKNSRPESCLPGIVSESAVSPDL